MSKSEHGTYKKIKTIANSKTATYTTGKLANNSVYYFKVRAYKEAKGMKSYGDYSELGSVARGKVEVKPAVLSKATVSKDKAVLTWKRQDSVSGYAVYMSKSAKGTYKEIKDIPEASVTEYTTGKLAKNTTYYFKVRPYKNVSGKKVYGTHSNVKTVKRTK